MNKKETMSRIWDEFENLKERVYREYYKNDCYEEAVRAWETANSELNGYTKALRDAGFIEQATKYAVGEEFIKVLKDITKEELGGK